MAVYAAAAGVLAGVESRQGSIKGLVYSSNFQVAGLDARSRGGVGEPGIGWDGPGWGREVGPAGAPDPACLSATQNVKQLYALVCETQRYSAVLDAVIASAGLLRAEKKLRPHLAK
ncbi:putative 28S rRNA (cytosine-C(5))-methyltransferase [Saguinus oedipus]|uniref:28S rRNA (Cytosine-C(5))-methyltransferase n=1 Tax=Saguinus oedipus TaxID=9490 RepID=A0ABQ9W739_SAGOE|nr:putative 28S rRNA (cytosine-C(5))-methyltransferase [Saguinus oedipus]